MGSVNHWGEATVEDGCPFCEIVVGRAPATVLREWDDALCIVPLNPVVPGHRLVIPKTHVQTIFSSPGVAAATMRRVSECLHGVERHLDPYDCNVITSAGPAATQTVMHFHVHLVPRSHGDGLALPWTSAAVIPEPPSDAPAEAEAIDAVAQVLNEAMPALPWLNGERMTIAQYRDDLRAVAVAVIDAYLAPGLTRSAPEEPT